MKKKAEKYWNDFLANTNREPNTKYFDCFYFGNTEQMANELLDLVIKGMKKATTSCHASYKISNENLPAVGDLSIVTDWEGTPKCVIETTFVTILPFKDVTFDICKREGEDDNLQSWQDGHCKFFVADGKKEGYHFTWDSLVVFEDFSIIHK